MVLIAVRLISYLLWIVRESDAMIDSIIIVDVRLSENSVLLHFRGGLFHSKSESQRLHDGLFHMLQYWGQPVSSFEPVSGLQQ
jgi:hypothetical protein